MSRLWDLWASIVRRYRKRAAELTAAELSDWISEGRSLQILDLRDAPAFHNGHLPDARHVPLARLEESLPGLDRSRATVLY